MKQIIVLLLSAALFACKSDLKTDKASLANINLVIKTDRKIDSVWISDIGQTESYFFPLSDTIKVDFKKELNDLYNVGFFTEDGRPTSQLWLNGDQVVISGRLDKKLEIDSVQNSDLYYDSVRFSKRIAELVENGADSSTIDQYLIREVREHVSSPFSFAIANTFIFRNQNNKVKIGQLFDELSVQSDSLKNHFVSIHSRIQNILSVDSLNAANYSFADLGNDLSSIELDNSKEYLLDFWFINCPPCVRDHKLISKKLGFLEDNNIELIGISTDRNHVAWKEYLEKHNYNWKNYREIDSLKRVTKDMAIWAFPTYLYVDSSGEIKARFNSFEDFEKSMEN